jgi:hypothetical protein
MKRQMDKETEREGF